MMLRGLYSGLSLCFTLASKHTRTCGSSKKIENVNVSMLDSRSKLGKTVASMSRWNVKLPTLFVLGGLVFLMLVIVVLPDVDLPDTAFHRGTAPVVVHSQANSAPAPVVVASSVKSQSGTRDVLARQRSTDFHLTPDPNFRPILLQSLRC